MSRVMAMQFDLNGDHQFIITLARQVISSSNSTLTLLTRQRRKLARSYLHGTTLDRCLRVCNKIFLIGMEEQILGSNPLLNGPQLSSDHQTVNMPPDLGQESDINSAWNAVILIRTTGSVQFYLSDWILLNKNERESSSLLRETEDWKTKFTK